MSVELRDAIAAEKMAAHGAANVDKVLSGFDRNDKDSMGQMEFCVLASSGEYWRIDKDGTGSKITGATEFSDGTTLADRTLVHFPTSGEANFSYWYQGAKVTKTTTQSVQIAGGIVATYTFYNSAGVLTEQDAESGHDLIVDETLNAIVCAGDMPYFADERHGIIMDGETHYSLHYSSNHGFSHHAGSDIAGLADGIGTHGAVASGGWFDEDILISVPGVSATEVPFIALIGSGNGEWTVLSVIDESLGYHNSSPIQYNTPGSGLIDLSSGEYLVTTFWATNNVIHPVIKLVGQKKYTSRKLARKHIEQDVFDIKTTGLPAPEMQLMAAVIVDYQGVLLDGDDDEVWLDYRQGFPVDRY